MPTVDPRAHLDTPKFPSPLYKHCTDKAITIAAANQGAGEYQTFLQAGLLRDSARA
jgi:hypothetical protein